MKVFFLDDQNHNAGDMLSKPVLEHLGFQVELVGRKVRGKLLAIGSVMSSLRNTDVVWGTGCIRDKEIIAPPITTFLAVRGPLTRNLIRHANIPERYGDAALLLPLVYNPKIEKRHKIGVVPHYVDKAIAPIGDNHFIDIQADWHTVVDEILSCERIISSSLHGIIIAETYGIPATWMVYSDNVIGAGFKFRDYYLGTGRNISAPGQEAPLIDGLAERQQMLVDAIKGHFHD